MKHCISRFVVLPVALFMAFILSFNFGTRAQTYATLPYYTGFESGLDASWIATTSLTTGQIAPFTAIYSTSWGNALPVAGSYFLGMHHPAAGGGAYNNNDAKLHLNLAGKNQVVLDFWWAEWNDETEPQDGVYISNNGGSTYTKIVNLPGASFTDLQWYHFYINMDSAVAASSLTYTSNFVIKFVQYDNYYFNGGNDGHLYDEINVYSICVPTANYTWAYNATPYSVDFTNTSTDTTNIFWNFGDGNTSALTSPGHTYTATGTYNVCMSATKTCGSDTICKQIKICDPLTSGFTNAISNLTVQFTNTASDTGNVLWTFGNGGNSTQVNPTYTYPSAGSYNVCLNVTNACGSKKYCDSITVCAPLIPSFTSTFGATLRTLNFTYTGLGATVVSYLWDFGDGDTSSAQNPSHTYANNGLYNVKVTVTNTCGSVFDTTITADIFNGIASFDPEVISIYPNPNRGKFYIGLSGVYNIDIYYADGRKLMTASYDKPAASGLREIDLGDVAPGIYLITVRNATGTANRKILIE